ncbi:MAG TPA: hypothetical protein DDY43_12380 [Synechococcales bacterium UBA10510]|nr:hypothetical protein [Synechococcales bacterium UBA10510]
MAGRSLGPFSRDPQETAVFQTLWLPIRKDQLGALSGQRLAGQNLWRSKSWRSRGWLCQSLGTPLAGNPQQKGRPVDFRDA